MNITIVGAGRMGSALAARLGAAGHDVTVTARHLERARAVAAEATASVAAASLDAAVTPATAVVILAVPYGEAADALGRIGSVDGKVVVDISNPLTAERDALAIGLTTSAAEEIAKARPGAKVVKAFNTLFADLLRQVPDDATRIRPQVLYAGDDADAKASIRGLIASLELEPVDAGPLRNARLLEPMGMLNIYLGHVAHRGTSIFPAWTQSRADLTTSG